MEKHIEELKNIWGKIYNYKVPTPAAFIIFLIFSLSIFNYAMSGLKNPDNSIKFNLIYYSIQTAATLLAAFNISRVTRENKEAKDYRRKEYSFEFVRSWDSPVISKARDFSREIKKELNGEHIDKIKHNPELRSAVILLFNFADNARLGLDNKILDEKIIKNLAPTFVAILKKYESYMEKEEWPKKSNPDVYKTDFYDTIEKLEKIQSS